MSRTTFKKRIPHTEVVEAQRRAAGATWTRLTDGYHYLYETFDYSLSEGNATALFATAKMTSRVQDAFRDLPFPVPDSVFELSRDPLVSEVMRRTGVQQRQQVVRRFYVHLNGFVEALSAWKENGREGPRPRPPYRRARYARVDWVHTRMEKTRVEVPRAEESYAEESSAEEDSPEEDSPEEDSPEEDSPEEGSPEEETPEGEKRPEGQRAGRYKEVLVLMTARGEPQIRVDWPHPTPRSVELIMEEGEATLCAQYDSEEQDLPANLVRDRDPQGERVAGVDLGESCLATAYDGEQALLFEGEALRQLRAVQNREARRFQKKMNRKEPGSRRWAKLKNARERRLKSLRDRADDMLHKITTRLVEGLWALGVGTVAIGDLSGIKSAIDYDADTNRRLHRWAFGKLSNRIEYKADRYGMEVRLIEESYTSQTCPQCGTAKKGHKQGRGFCCSGCGLEAHRDVVGAANIRAKAQEPDHWQSGHLKADRAPATGEAPSSPGEEASSPTGSPSGRKTPQLSLFGSNSEKDGPEKTGPEKDRSEKDGDQAESQGAAASTRATLQAPQEDVPQQDLPQKGVSREKDVSREVPGEAADITTGPLGPSIHVRYDPHMECVLKEA